MLSNRVYGINLESRPDRLIYLEYETKTAGLDLQRVEAIDGSQFSDYDIPYGSKFRNTREYACALSHLKAWKQAIEKEDTSSEKYILFVEDDVIFVKNFYKLCNGVTGPLNQHHNTFLYIGHLHYSEKRVGTKDTEINSAYWIKRRPVYGLHCYAIKAKDLEDLHKKITDDICHSSDGQAIDDLITYKYPDICAVLKTPLAYQRIGSTDVNSERRLVNMSYMRILNPPDLKALFDPTLYPMKQVTRQVVVLPGLKWLFPRPTNLTIIEIQYYYEIPEYERFARVVPIEYWAALRYGGMIFKKHLSPWIDKFAILNEDVDTNEYIFCDAGSGMIKRTIIEIISNFEWPRDDPKSWF